MLRSEDRLRRPILDVPGIPHAADRPRTARARDSEVRRSAQCVAVAQSGLSNHSVLSIFKLRDCHLIRPLLRLTGRRRKRGF